MLSKFFSFKGRMGLNSYRGLTIGAGIVYRVVRGGHDFVTFAVCLILLAMLLSIGARRCHDIGKSGWWYLIPFYSVYLFFAKSDPNDNEYGPAPLEEAEN